MAIIVLFVISMWVIIVLFVIAMWVVLKKKDETSQDVYVPLPGDMQRMDYNIRNALRTLNTRDKGHCIHCGTELPNSGKFCPTCGKEQSVFLSVQFSAGNTEAILNQASQWLADNPFVWNVKMTADKGTTIGLFTNKATLRSLTLSYEVKSQINPYQYAVLQIEKHNGFMIIDSNKVVNLWESNNPNGKVVNWTGQINSRGQNGTIGYGACHTCQIFMLAAFKTRQSLPQEKPQIRKIEPSIII